MKTAFAIAAAIGAATLVVITILVMHARGGAPAQAAGAPLLPALEERAGEIAAIECLRGNATVRLERGADGAWIVASSEGYPARTELVRALVASAARLTLQERMTGKRARHGALGLAWPDASGKARLVRLLGGAPGAAPIAEIVFGEERFAPDGIFVRRFDEEQTWRAAGRLQLPGDALEWMDRTLFALPAGETKRAAIAGLALVRPIGGAANEPGTPAPRWAPEIADAERDHWTPEQVASAQTGLPSFLERLEFEAVRHARGDTVPEPAWSPTFETEGASIAVNGREEADGLWITLAIVPRPNAPRPPATPPEPGEPFIPDYAALAKQVAGWEYRVPDWKRETLRRMRAATAPATPAAPLPAPAEPAPIAPPAP
ncbi:MAG: DUF4340 domain-containing protein [Phycisphaerales bacterium]